MVVNYFFSTVSAALRNLNRILEKKDIKKKKKQHSQTSMMELYRENN